MRARAHVALGGRNLTYSEAADGGRYQLEHQDILGEDVPASGDTSKDWRAAQAACPVPDDAMVLYWMSEA